MKVEIVQFNGTISKVFVDGKEVNYLVINEGDEGEINRTWGGPDAR